MGPTVFGMFAVLSIGVALGVAIMFTVNPPPEDEE